MRQVLPHIETERKGNEIGNLLVRSRIESLQVQAKDARKGGKCVLLRRFRLAVAGWTVDGIRQRLGASEMVKNGSNGDLPTPRVALGQRVI